MKKFITLSPKFKKKTSYMADSKLSDWCRKWRLPLYRYHIWRQSLRISCYIRCMKNRLKLALWLAWKWSFFSSLRKWKSNIRPTISYSIWYVVDVWKLFLIVTSRYIWWKLELTVRRSGKQYRKHPTTLKNRKITKLKQKHKISFYTQKQLKIQ